MTIQRRFFLIFSISLVIAVTLSVCTISAMEKVHRSYEEVAHETLPFVIALEDLRYAALRIVSSTSEYGLVSVIGAALEEAGGDNLEKERENELNEAGPEALDDVIERLRGFAGAGGMIASGTLEEFETLVDGLKSTGEELRFEIDQLENFEEISELKERLEELEEEILELTSLEIMSMRQSLNTDHVNIQVSIDSATQFMVAHAAIFGLLLFVFWTVINRTVVYPIRDLNSATSELANGNFGYLPKFHAHDEVGALAKAFGDMSRSLQRLFSEKQHALEAAHRNELRFRDIADAASDWIWETDADHRIVFLSDRFSKVTGLDVQAVIGKQLEEVLLPGDQNNNVAVNLAHHKYLRDLRCRIATRNNDMSICRASGKPHFESDGTFTGYRGTVTDISEQVAAEKKAQHLALHDALTGLPNRTLLEERMRHSLAEAKREGQSVAVIGIDLDRFKEVNDSLGHAAGDSLLKTVAERLTALTRDTDTVARIGGDEFVILQAGAKQPRDAEALCQRILEVLEQPSDNGEYTVYPAASLGVALSPDDGTDTEVLLKHADIAMYRSKKDGRGTFCFFKPGMNEEIQERKRAENELRTAIDLNQMILCFQPLIHADHKTVVGFEALVRWQHPEQGLLAPNSFIPLAEETGLILPLGEWVLRSACEAAVAWSDRFVAVNLSPVQFRDLNLVKTISRILQETGLPPELLELEITESVLLADADYAFMVLDALREIGVRIAMDDFGTGYSSLSYLQRFHFDKIKLDRSFVDAVANSEESRAIVKAVLMLGRTLGMTTTAEGVETQGHVEFLAAENCDQFQGFYFSKPLPADELQSFIDKSEQRTSFKREAGADIRATKINKRQRLKG